jgi:dihydrofolate reductase
MQAIVAVSENWGIGKDNDLLFRISADLKRFRELTAGHTVVMGRKTLESLPGGKGLPKRRNIVLTSHNIEIEGAEVVHTTEEMLKAVENEDTDTVFVIGGGSLYTALLPLCKRVYLTKVDAVGEGADTWFPNLDKLPNWQVEQESEPIEENGISYRFIDYVNTKL